MTDEEAPQSEGVQGENVTPYVFKELPGGAVYWGPEKDLPRVPNESEIDTEIDNLHSSIVGSLTNFESIVVTNLKDSGNQVDPKGFYVVVFDADRVSEVAVLDISVPSMVTGDDLSDDAAFELSFHYVKDKSKTVNFSSGGARLSLDLTERTTGDNQTEEMELLLSENIFYRKTTISGEGVTKEFEYKVDHELTLEEQLEEKYKAYWKLGEVKTILDDLTKSGQNKYHMRIFGNQGRTNSPQKPAFIIAGGGSLPANSK